MTPRKKQRIDNGDALRLPVAIVPRRTRRASAKAAKAGNVIAEDPPVVAVRRGNTKAPATDAVKPIALKGRLQTLADIPVDVQLEICNYLDLEDLFSLSRTSKNFRDLLSNKKLEKTLWVPARANTPGIPDRPPWMSERQFVYLLYSPHCHNCGASNIRKEIFGCFTRLCAACLQDRTVWFKDARAEASEIDRSRTLGRLFRQDTIAYLFHVQGQSPDPYDHKDNRLLREDVDRVFARFRALPASSVADSNGAYNHDKAQAFYDQIKAETSNRRPYANAIHVWLQGKEMQRQASLREARKQRFNVIVAKLRAAGWQKDLDFLGAEGLAEMANMPVVRQSSKLTEGAWQKVLAALDNFLNDTRARRLEKELRATLTVRFKLLEEAIQAHYVTLPRSAQMDCRPQYIDFAFTPEVRAIAESPTSDTVTVEQFAALVPALADRWEADRREELSAYLRPHLGTVAAGVDPLALAIAVFKTQPDLSCGKPIALMRYPALFAHAHYASCVRGTACGDAAAFRRQDVYTRTMQSLTWRKYEFEQLDEHPDWEVCVHSPFHLGGLVGGAAAGDAVEGMRRIVTALGLDPARATFDDLERCDGWLRCVTCETDEPHETIWARSWRSAYKHDEEHVSGVQGAQRTIPKWRRADDEDMEKVRAPREDTFPNVDFERFERSAMWSCSLCPAFDAIWKAMSAHFEETHEIADPCQAKVDGIVYLHPNCDKEGASADTVRLRGRLDPKTGLAVIPKYPWMH